MVKILYFKVRIVFSCVVPPSSVAYCAKIAVMPTPLLVIRNHANPNTAYEFAEDVASL